MSNHVTIHSYEKLQEELKIAKKNKPLISADIETAREHGDLKENAEYHAAREEQGLNEARIALLESRIANAIVVDTSKLAKDKIYFGSKALLVNCETDKEVTYQIVGEDEASVQDGFLFVGSPLGRVLISKKIGDVVVVRAPKGDIEYEILEIL